MSKFTVETNQLRSTANELSSLNSEFKSRVNELLNLQQELHSEWSGEANDAFNKAFSSDKGQWDTFANLVDKYITALTTIATTYDKAESANVTTATNRSY